MICKSDRAWLLDASVPTAIQEPDEGAIDVFYMVRGPFGLMSDYCSH